MNFDAIDGPTVGLSGSRPDQRIKTLLQTGLGDHIVSTVAFEFMGRDYGASAYAQVTHRRFISSKPIDPESNVGVYSTVYPASKKKCCSFCGNKQRTYLYTLY